MINAIGFCFNLTFKKPEHLYNRPQPSIGLSLKEQDSHCDTVACLAGYNVLSPFLIKVKSGMSLPGPSGRVVGTSQEHR